MCSRKCFWVLGIALGLAVSACGGGGSAPPSVELVADPEICDVPCQVLLDSGVEARADDGLTFTWDLGGGPVEGDARLLHTFEVAGTYEVALTVSGASGSTSETVTVVAEPQPKTSGTVDASGGSVSHGDFTTTVPEGVAPEAFPIEVTELPSMQVAAERRLGEGRFTALGSAYQITTPAKSSVAFDIAVRSPETEGADVNELAWLVRMISRPMPFPDQTEAPPSLAPVASYVLAPVTRLDADGTAHGDIYGRSRVQLVRLSEPLDIDTNSAVAGITSKQLSDLIIVVSTHATTALPKQQYVDAIIEGARKAHDFLTNEKQFLWLQESLSVYVQPVANGAAAEVPNHNPNTILVGPALTSTDQIKKTVAHEFFHLIQNWHSNSVSSAASHNNDAWFAEGSACWAMDEVYDDIQGYYFATPRGRLQEPMVKPKTKADAVDAYRTVAFWKWAETHNSEIVRAVLQDRFARSHSIVGSSAIIENTVVTDYLTSFKALWPDADFLQFAYDSLYEKDYDESETRENELWSSKGALPLLGPKNEVTPTSKLKVEAGKGDSEANAVTTLLIVQPHLSSDVVEVGSKGLKGTLHVRFPQLSEPLDARVFVLDTNSNVLEDSYTLRDLSKKHEDAKVIFDPDKKAEILVVDPRWSYPSSKNPIQGNVAVWVEDPCGPLPSNVINATDEDGLYAALTAAPSGSVVKLPAKTFVPPIRDWPLPEEERTGEWTTQVLVKDVTLAGAGAGQTTLSMRGDEFGSVGLTTFGNVTLRDLTIDAGEFWGVTAIGAKSLTLCNVTVETRGADGVQFSQWPEGGDGFLGIYNSNITYLGSISERHAGMELSCLDQSGDIAVEIRDSNISDWYVGVSYTNYSTDNCSVSVSTDCKGFSNNELANVMHTECTPPDCTQFVEECP
jgi:PKD repeat protein